MKKMKRFLVAMLGGLTAIACLAGVSACKKDNEEAKQPSYEININRPAVEVEKEPEDPTKGCVHSYTVVYEEVKGSCMDGSFVWDEQGNGYYHAREGYKVLGCSKCGAAITVTTGYGHDFGEATCEEAATCKLCGTKKNVFTAECTYLPATCTEDAYCTVCGEVAEEAKGHDWVAPTAHGKAATCKVCKIEYDVEPFLDLSEDLDGDGEISEEEILIVLNPEYDEDLAGHTLVNAFGSRVDDESSEVFYYFEEFFPEGIEDYLAYDSNGYRYLKAYDCDKAGYEHFTFCVDCMDEFDFEAEENLAYQNFLAKEGLTAEDVMDYFFGANGVVYAEGYKKIAPAHTMINLYGTADEVNGTKDNNKDGKIDDADKVALIVKTPNKKGEYFVQTCETGSVKNFKVCAVCLAKYVAQDEVEALDANSTIADLRAAFVDADKEDNEPAAVYSTYVEGEAKGHNYLDSKTNMLYLVPGVKAECGKPGSEWYGWCVVCEEFVNAKEGASFDDFDDAAKDVAAPAEAHDYTAEGSKQVTCYVDGYCAVCDTVVEKLEHTISTDDVDEDSTCTVLGIKAIKTCTAVHGDVECDYVEVVYQDSYAAHAWAPISEDNGALPYTLNAEGEEVYYCKPGEGLDNGYYCAECNQYATYASNKYTIKDVADAFKTGKKPDKTHATLVWAEDVAKEDQCETDKMCPDCEVVIADSAPGHKFTDHGEGTCSHCEKTVINEHKWVLVEYKAPDCVEKKAGNVAYFKCQCKTGTTVYTLADSEGNPGEPTYTDDAGNEVKYALADFTLKAEHKWTEVEAKIVPTACDEPAYTAHKVCDYCGTKEGYKEGSLTCASTLANNTCLAEVYCDKGCFHFADTNGDEVIDEEDLKAYGWKDSNKNGLVDANEVPDVEGVTWTGCHKKVTNHKPNNNHAFDENDKCVICGKKEN